MLVIALEPGETRAALLRRLAGAMLAAERGVWVADPATSLGVAAGAVSGGFNDTARTARTCAAAGAADAATKRFGGAISGDAAESHVGDMRVCPSYGIIIYVPTLYTESAEFPRDLAREVAELDSAPEMRSDIHSDIITRASEYGALIETSDRKAETHVLNCGRLRAYVRQKRAPFDRYIVTDCGGIDFYQRFAPGVHVGTGRAWFLVSTKCLVEWAPARGVFAGYMGVFPYDRFDDLWDDAGLTRHVATFTNTSYHNLLVNRAYASLLFDPYDGAAPAGIGACTSLAQWVAAWQAQLRPPPDVAFAARSLAFVVAWGVGRFAPGVPFATHAPTFLDAPRRGEVRSESPCGITFGPPEPPGAEEVRSELGPPEPPGAPDGLEVAACSLVGQEFTQDRGLLQLYVSDALGLSVLDGGNAPGGAKDVPKFLLFMLDSRHARYPLVLGRRGVQ